jgi:AcrR family transcriptional regulator
MSTVKMTTSKTGARGAAKLATRHALIDAALTELIEHGPASSLDAICERAGFTRGAFYVHFADREALLVAVMDRALGELLRSIIADSGATKDRGIVGGIRQFTKAAAARSPAVHPDRGLRLHHVLEACRTSRAIGDRYRAILTAAADWAAAQRRGRLASLDLKSAGDIVLASGLGLLVMLELGMPIDPERFGEALISTLELEPRKASPKSEAIDEPDGVRGTARRPRRDHRPRRPPATER